jgi:hypothetical protein
MKNDELSLQGLAYRTYQSCRSSPASVSPLADVPTGTSLQVQTYRYNYACEQVPVRKYLQI